MRNQLKHFAVVAVLLAVVCAANRNAFAKEATLTDRAQQSIVYIWFEVTNPATGAKSLVYGTGFIVSETGYVLTASHLFRDWEKQMEVNKKQNLIKGSLRNKEGLVTESPLTLEVINPGNAEYEDVALLKLPGAVQSFSVASICLREASAARGGDKIMGYGFPQNEPFQGVEGTLGTTNAPRGRWAVSAPFTYGMSGGPVYDKRGFVVGLIRGGIPGTPAVTWITPIQHAIGLLNQAGYKDCALPPPQTDPSARQSDQPSLPALPMIHPKDARFGVTLGWQLGRYEFAKDSIFPEARRASIHIEQDITALLQQDAYPRSIEGQSANQVIQGILLYYGGTNLEKHASILVGIAALRASLVGASSNPKNNEEMKRLSFSAIQEIDDSVISRKEEFFEELVAQHPKNVSDTLRLLAGAKLR